MVRAVIAVEYAARTVSTSTSTQRQVDAVMLYCVV